MTDSLPSYCSQQPPELKAVSFVGHTSTSPLDQHTTSYPLIALHFAIQPPCRCCSPTSRPPLLCSADGRRSPALPHRALPR
jgi:hypothetical protein